MAVYLLFYVLILYGAHSISASVSVSFSLSPQEDSDYIRKNEIFQWIQRLTFAPYLLT